MPKDKKFVLFLNWSDNIVIKIVWLIKELWTRIVSYCYLKILIET